MIDHYHHAAGLRGSLCLYRRLRVLKKGAQSRDVFLAELECTGTFEKDPMRPNDKKKLITPMGLHTAELPDQFDGLTPAQIAGEFSLK